MKLGQLEKKLFLTFFPTLILQEKIAKFELNHQKKALDGCS